MIGILGNMFDMNQYDVERDDDELTELELAGINPEELEYMGEEERREILKLAGLDPDKYDF